MNLYRIQWTHSIRSGEHSEDVVEYFEATNDSAAITEANNRFSAGAINKKLYNLGTEVVFP